MTTTTDPTPTGDEPAASDLDPLGASLVQVLTTDETGSALVGEHNPTEVAARAIAVLHAVGLALRSNGLPVMPLVAEHLDAFGPPARPRTASQRLAAGLRSSRYATTPKE